MSNQKREESLDLKKLRQAIQEEYEEVALNPEQGFHFHTGRPLAQMLGYADQWLEGIPEAAIASFAGTGNPFSLGEIKPGNHVVDIGAGAGFDSLIAARMVDPTGHVIGVDMTPAMLDKARRAVDEARLDNCEFREGLAGPMWSSLTACSTCCRINPSPSKRWPVCSSPLVACRSPISWSRKRYPRVLNGI